VWGIFNYDRSCGSCGGKVKINGACSISTPSKLGNSCTVGKGICQKTGTIQCDGKCSATPGSSSAEVCDNLDNDCNGVVDNGCDNDKDGFVNPTLTCSGNFRDGNGVVRPCP
jgi:hypothetical protein